MERIAQKVAPRRQRSWGHLRIPISNLPISLTPSSLPTDDLTSYFSEPVFYPHILHFLLLSYLLLPKASNFSYTLNLILLPLLKDIPSAVLPSFSFIFQVFFLWNHSHQHTYICFFSHLKRQNKTSFNPTPGIN